MTATDPAPLVCPACRSTETSVAGSGLALCFACTEQWDPAVVVAAPAPVEGYQPPPDADDVERHRPYRRHAIQPFSMASVEEVFDQSSPPPVDTSSHPAASAVTLETTVATPPAEPDAHDYPPTWAGLESFRAAGGVISDELWYDNFIAPAAEPLHPADAIDPGALAVLAVQAELAALIVKAAVASPADVTDYGFKSFPPAGFLPTTKDLQPVIEQAAVQAVRGLIAVYALDPAQILAALGVVSETPTQGDPTTEVASEQ